MKLKFACGLIGLIAISGCGKAPSAGTSHPPQAVLSVLTDKAGVTSMGVSELRAILATAREVPKSDFPYLTYSVLPPVQGVAVLDSGRIVAWSFYFCSGLRLQMLDGTERFYLPR